MGPELVVRHGCGPELVVGSCVHGVRAAWLCIGPGLVLRVGLIVDGDCHEKFCPPENYYPRSKYFRNFLSVTEIFCPLVIHVYRYKRTW